MWLKIVPEYSVAFVQWILIYCLVDTLINPLAVVVQATGKIRKYQVVCSIYVLLNIPLAFLLIYLSLNPVYVFVGRVIINIASLLWRLYYVKVHIGIILTDYWYHVIKLVMVCGGVAMLISLFPLSVWDGLERLVFSFLCWLLAFVPLTWFYGLTFQERLYVKSAWNKFCGKLKR